MIWHTANYAELKRYIYILCIFNQDVIVIIEASDTIVIYQIRHETCINFISNVCIHVFLVVPSTHRKRHLVGR